MTIQRHYLSLGLILIGLGLLLLVQPITDLDFLAGIVPAGLLWLVAFWCWKQYTPAGSLGWLLLAFVIAFAGLAAFNSGIELVPGKLFGPIFLWGLGTAFAFHWRRRRPEAWGLLFLAGLATTLGWVALFGSIWTLEAYAGVAFFAGLAGTFFILHRRYEATGRLPWAKYAAVASAILAAIVFAQVAYSPLAELLPGIILIAAGAYLLWHAMRGAAEEKGNLGSA